MGKGKPRGLNSARKLRTHRREKYVYPFRRKKLMNDVAVDKE
jgi:hypothetical protein